MACQKLGPKGLVKIGSVTAEVFMIWTNVAWTNFTMRVGICSRGLKFGQNWASNS